MRFWWYKKEKHNKVNHPALISILEKGNSTDIRQFLFQPEDIFIDYLPATYEMLLKLKRPADSPGNLSIYKTFENGNYQLIIFNVPWNENDVPYSPIILNKIEGKIVGIMLPFNEISDYLSKKDNKIIAGLSTNWITLVMKFRFGI